MSTLLILAGTLTITVKNSTPNKLDHNGAGHQDTHHDKPGDILFNILQRVLEQDNNAEIRNFYRQQILK